MNALNDDPRLTAYALGELPKSERAALEAELRQSPASLKDVDAIQKLGALLEEELGAEPCPRLDDLTRARIEDKARATSDVPAWAEPVKKTGGAAAPPPPWYRRPPRAAWAAAAVVVFAAGLGMLFTISGAKRGRAMMAERRYGPAGAKEDRRLAAAEERKQRERERAIYALQTEQQKQAQQRPSIPGAPQRPRVSIDQVERPDRQPAGPAENPFVAAAQQPVSTFSSDVDTASYARVRSLLKQGILPRPDDVRLEELINYFRYDYAPPTGKTPFAVHTEVAQCPWKPEHLLLRVGIQGKQIDFSQRPSSNLVFLLDVSGSMQARNKLPLLKRSLRLMLSRLGENDRVAIVVYAGASGLALPSTPASDSSRILGALSGLTAGGSTNGGAGIQLAYRIAAENFIPGGINRVVLATDGDFNVGVSDQRALVRLIEQKAKSKIFLSVLGFGMSHGDRRLEAISNHGNGNYAFIDSLAEAKKVLVKELGGTLVTIAKDVKLQLRFDPEHVSSYRLIGYENRVMANKDFDDDTKDAGEIGSGHTVTAFYEVVPRSKGQEGELATVRIRYKQPEGNTSQLIEHGVNLSSTRADDASTDFRFASAVAGFGLLLKHSRYKGQASWPLIEELARGSLGKDREGYRKELLELVQTARVLDR